LYFLVISSCNCFYFIELYRAFVGLFKDCSVELFLLSLKKNKLFTYSMKKIYSFLFAVLCTIQVANAQYYYLPYIIEGENPGGINEDPEAPVGGGLPTNWTTILTSPASTPIWSPVQNIGFPFSFNGVAVTQFKVSNSAVVTFDVATAVAAPTYTRAALPSALIPDKSVCIWGLSALGTNDNVVRKTFGTAPNRQLWIQFGSYGYGTVASTGSTFTYWSIVLEETTNNIYVVDQRTGGYSSTKLVSIGLQIDASTAVSVAGSPNLLAKAGTSNAPDDNTFYKFVYGTQASFEAELKSLSYNQFVIVPGTSFISGIIRNFGTATITSANLNYELAGTIYTESLTGLNIPFASNYTFYHNTPVNVTSPSPYDLKVWVDVAGDADHSNDSMDANVTGLAFQTTKRVLVEEATGTWCGWCPRGAVYTEKIDTVYPNSAIVVAVHNNDPMENTVYDAGMAGLISGYPGGAVDRKDLSVDPTDFEARYLDRINDVSPADLAVSAYFDANSRQLDVVVSATFAADAAGDYRLNAIIVEDEVTGTTAQYSQANYYYNYSTILVGAGHDWNVEPNPVPFSSMEYNFVGREILGGFDGVANSLPPTVSANNTYSYTFSYVVPATYEEAHMRVIGVLHDAETGFILNVNRGAYGLTTAVSETQTPEFTMSMYPNPATDFAQLEIDLQKSGAFTVELFDVMGKNVFSRTSAASAGKNVFNIPVNSLQDGVYMVKVNVNGSVATKRLIIR
jgi:thiol-disulfide isomerase/thioredoxin